MMFEARCNGFNSEDDMQVGRILIAFPALFLVVFASDAVADAPFSKVTAFANLEVKPPEILGTLWIDRDAVEAKFPIDKDGDTQYTEGELFTIRGPLTNYVNQHFHLMWGGKTHPIVLKNATFEVRPNSKNNCVKLTFSSPQYSAGESLLIFSTLLSDLSRQGRTLVSIEGDGRREVCVLGPDSYYDSRLTSTAPGTTSQPAAATRKTRFGCLGLCLGVESPREMTKCPRCGGPVVALSGGPMPGKGYLGSHGGTLMPFVPGQIRVEGILAKPEEFRVYLVSEELDAMPAGSLSGTVQIWTDKMEQTSMHKEGLKVSTNGAYLWASVPKGMILPIRARCMLDVGDGKGQRMVEFFLPGVVAVPD